MPTLQDLKPATPMQKELVGLAIALASFGKKMIDDNQDLAPLLHARTPDGDMLVPLAELMTDELGDIKGAIISALLRERHATLYAMTFEAWGLMAKPDESLADDREGRIRDHPLRVSTFCITGETIDGDSFAGFWKIQEPITLIRPDRSLNLDTPQILTLSGKDEPNALPAGQLSGLLKGAASRAGRTRH
jgi:hypothetical protein